MNLSIQDLFYFHIFFFVQVSTALYSCCSGHSYKIEHSKMES